MGVAVEEPEYEAVDLNKNVNWMESPAFWTFYTIVLGSIYMATPLFVAPSESWTWVNIIHGVISFGIMHWVKGTPDDNALNDNRELTFFEQIDQGRPWTATKKFLMMVPTVLFLLASVSTDYDWKHLAVNSPIWLILIIAKMPGLDRVRIFGINSTPGIDDVKKDL